MEIYAKRRGNENLEGFARRTSALFGIGNLEERDSSSYVGEVYYLGSALSVELAFGIADNAILTDYDYCIWVNSDGIVTDARNSLDGLIDLLARRMTVNGDSVAWRPSNGKNGPIVFYELDQTAQEFTREQVIVTRR